MHKGVVPAVESLYVLLEDHQIGEGSAIAYPLRVFEGKGKSSEEP